MEVTITATGYGGFGQVVETLLHSTRPRTLPAESQRRYPDLVTIEVAPDDEEVFGKAWPLAAE